MDIPEDEQRRRLSLIHDTTIKGDNEIKYWTTLSSYSKTNII